MADFRAGSWTHPSGGFRSGSAAYTALGNQISGAAAAVASASGSLTTGAGFSGSATGDATAAGVLVNWLAVTVASPNNGIGSIFDARYWTGAPPADGDLIRHEDRDGFSVAPNGQYSATLPGSYLVQFAYLSAPNVWYYTTVDILQTDFAGDASAQAAATGDLTAGPAGWYGPASGQATASGDLTTQAGNGLSGTASADASASAALTTGINMAGAASGDATATGSFENSTNDGNSNMGQPSVIVNNLNLAQGSFPEIERKALFLGVGATNVNQLLVINTQSKLDDVLGAAASEIKLNVAAAKANGGENWMCYAIPLAAGYNWEAVVDSAMETISPEFIVLCTPATSAAQLNAMQTKAELLRTSLARRVIIVTATPGINPATQTWSQYETAQAAITAGVAAYRVGAVPQLHGNDLGCVMGRLCNHSVSIADSPMRVATGPILGLGATPVDSAGKNLSSTTPGALDNARLSCIYRYPDYDGTYWGNLNLLDVAAGDYQVVENLRVMDKAARAVRILAIARVANRSFNNTPASIVSNKTYFSRPLREMSHSTVFAGETFPGEIMSPKSDAVTIVWPTRTSVEVYLKLQPYNCPKQITANLVLDLSGQI